MANFYRSKSSLNRALLEAPEEGSPEEVAELFIERVRLRGFESTIFWI